MSSGRGSGLRSIYEVALDAVKLASDASGTSRDEEELPELDLAPPDHRGGRRKAAASGAIEIADRFSLVEVPKTAADDVVAALRQVSIKGRKATVRRERYRAAR